MSRGFYPCFYFVYQCGCVYYNKINIRSLSLKYHTKITAFILICRYKTDRNFNPCSTLYPPIYIICVIMYYYNNT